MDHHGFKYENKIAHMIDMTINHDHRCKKIITIFLTNYYRTQPKMMSGIVGGALVFTKLNDLAKLKKDPNVWRIICKGGLHTFIKACRETNSRLVDYVVST